MVSIEYIAAFIDGEGSIKASEGIRLNPAIEITNTYKEVLEEIADSIEYMVDARPSMFEYKKYKPNHNQCYGLYIGAPIMRELLPILIPELRIKRFQAEAMLELISIEGMKGCKGDPETRQKKIELVQKIKWANGGCI
jgi:hypothetical protein